MKMFRYSKREKKNFPFVYLLIAFPVLQFAIFWGYVNFDSILLAFRTWNGTWTLDNFGKVIEAFVTEDMYGYNLFRTVGRSFLLWAVRNVLVFPISVVTTYVLFKRVWLHYGFRVVFIVPALVGGVVWTLLIRSLVAYDGPVLELANKLGIQVSPLVKRNGLLGSASTAFPTLLVVTFLTGIAGGSPILTGAFSRIPKEIFDSCKIDGFSFWKEFRYVSLPLIWPTLATLLTFAFCSILTDDCNVFLYSQGTGEPEMATTGFYLYYMVFRISNSPLGEKAYNYPAAVGLFLTALTVPIALSVRKILDKVMDDVTL